MLGHWTGANDMFDCFHFRPCLLVKVRLHVSRVFYYHRYYRPQTNCATGYVFTGVCHNVHRGGECVDGPNHPFVVARGVYVVDDHITACTVALGGVTCK